MEPLSSDLDLAELEQEFRSSWVGYDPHRITSFLDRAEVNSRTELLVRLLCAEIEYHYQPPADVQQRIAEDDQDDQRVRPTLALFLLRFPELRREPEAMIRLAILEYAHRLRSDPVAPNPDSYLPMFEEDPVTQDRVYQLLRLADRRLSRQTVDQQWQPPAPDDPTIKDAELSPSLHALPLPATLNCFLLLRQLGRGGMGYVYLAIDLRSAGLVAVKVMRRTDAWSVYRFHEEFSWLARLNHPHLVQLYDAYREGDLRYFSMEFIEGTTLPQWFSRRKQKRPERCMRELRSVLLQIAGAIHYLHVQEVIHCDIKCSNVMIAGRHQAKLLDLGLAIRAGHDLPIMGTLQYMAPEILRGDSPTSASDWYSFGVLIFEVLTGEYPQTATSPEPREPDAPASIDVPLLREQLIASGSDTDLVDLCIRLLDSDATKRPTGAEVLQVLGAQVNAEVHTERQVFVGRDIELEQLRQLLERSPDESPKLTILRGAAGLGKTTLLNAFAPMIPRSEWIVIKIDSLRQAHMSLRLMHAILQELTEVLYRGKLLDQHGRVELMALQNMTRIFPQVRRLVETESESAQRLPANVPNETTIQQALTEARQWIAAISQRQRLFVIIDDISRSDDTSIRQLSLIAQDHQFVGQILVSADEDAFEDVRLKWLVTPAPASQSTDPSAIVELRPLDQSARLELAQHWCRRLGFEIDDQTAEKLSTQSQGNPFLLSELLRAAAAEQSSYGPRKNSLASRRRSDAESKEFLPIQAENVLQYLSIAEEPISFHQLQMVSRVEPSELQHAIDLLSSRGWIRSGYDRWDEKIRLAHDSFRQPIQARMPEARKRRRHYRMARMLSVQVPPNWASMAYHYLAAGSIHEAAACYLEAGRQSYAARDFATALRYLSRAEQSNLQRSLKEQESLLRMKAECAAAIGNAYTAARIYDALAGRAKTEAEQDEYAAFAAEQWLRGGDLARALSRLRGLARETRMRGLTNQSAWIHSIVRVRIFTLAIVHRNGWKLPSDTARDFTKMEQCLSRIPLPATFLDSRIGARIQLQQMALIRTAGSAGDRSRVLLNSALLLAAAGRPTLTTALRWLQQGSWLAKYSEDPTSRGQVYLSLTIWLVLRGKFANAARIAEKSLGAFGQQLNTSVWEFRFTQWLQIAAFWYQGDIAAMRNVTSRLRQSCADHDDHISLLFGHIGVPVLGDLFLGHEQQAKDSLDISSRAIADPHFHSPRFFWWLAHVALKLYQDDAAGAYAALLEQWPKLRSDYLFASPHYRWLALSMRICGCLAMLDADETRRGHFARQAKKYIRRLSRLSEPGLAAHAAVFETALQLRLGQPIGVTRILDDIAPLAKRGHQLAANAARLMLIGGADPLPPDAYQQFTKSLRWFKQHACKDIVATTRFLLPLPPSIQQRVREEYQRLA